MSAFDREFTYRPTWSTAIFATTFFSACAYISAHIAMHRDYKAYRIASAIGLPAGIVDGFFWLLSAACVAFVVLGVLLALHRIVRDQRILLTQSSISLPKALWSPKNIQIRYDSIGNLSIKEVNGHRFIQFRDANGAKYTIAHNVLPTKDAFDEIYDWLKQHTDPTKTFEPKSMINLPPSPEQLKSLLRGLLIGEICLAVIIIMAYAGFGFYIGFNAAYEPQLSTEQEGLTASETVVLGFSFLGLVVGLPSLVVAYVGLFRSRNWARWLYLGCMALAYVGMLPISLFQYSYAHDWGLLHALNGVAAVITGCNLSLLFFSELARTFSTPIVSSSAQDTP